MGEGSSRARADRRSGGAAERYRRGRHDAALTALLRCTTREMPVLHKDPPRGALSRRAVLCGWARFASHPFYKSLFFKTTTCWVGWFAVLAVRHVVQRGKSPLLVFYGTHARAEKTIRRSHPFVITGVLRSSRELSVSHIRRSSAGEEHPKKKKKKKSFWYRAHFVWPTL